MGIQLIQRPKDQSHEAPGPLSLPVEFDRKKFAAKWVKEGPAVAAAAEREWIPGTQLTADGWKVWKNAEGKPYKVSLQSGAHILLYRSQAVQKGVNAICGNIGKERLIQERQGVTTGGVPVDDPGMLSEERIAKVMGPDGTAGEGDVRMNPVGEIERQQVTTPTLKTVQRRAEKSESVA